LQSHRWTDAQLQTLDEVLARPDFIAGLSYSLHGERAALNDAILDAIRRRESLSPMIALGDGPANPWVGLAANCFIYQNMLGLDRFYEKYVFVSFDPAAHRIYPAIAREGDRSLKNIRLPLHPYEILEAIAMPVVDTVLAKTAYAQVSTDQALIACALERHRLASGAYPDALAKLAPAYLKQIPLDVTTGAPMHYRLNPDGTFLLYSDGWSGIDNGGKVALKPGSDSIDIENGDWVWSTVSKL
jgi:hypothetical protein